MPSSSSGHIIQASNVSQQTSRDQMYTLFSFLGRIAELKLYPTETNPYFGTYDKKICFVKYEDASAAEAAQHLTNTVLIDRALVIVPYTDSSNIPDEASALRIHPPVMPGHRHMPPSLINQIVPGEQDEQVIATVDPSLTTNGLPPYPTLPANTDAGKIEEIRRTVYVGDISKEATGDELVRFLTDSVGEVMYLRFAGDRDLLPCQYAFVEFADQSSVVKALKEQANLEFKGGLLRIQHSSQAVKKPQAKTADAVQAEIEEAMAKAADRVAQDNGYRSSRSPSRYDERSSSRRRSKSRSRSRHRSSRRSRSRSRSRDRKSRRRSREKDQGAAAPKNESDSRDRRRRKSRSRERTSRRSRSRDRKRKRERSNSRDKKRHRSRSKSKEKRTKKRSRSRSVSPKKSKDSKSSKSTSSSSRKDKEKNGESSKSSDKKKSERKPSTSSEQKSKTAKAAPKKSDGSSSEDEKKDGKKASSYGPVLPPSAQDDQQDDDKSKSMSLDD